MPEQARRTGLAEASVAAAGMAVFALFAHRGGMLRIVAGAGLLAAAGAIVWGLRGEVAPLRLFGLWPIPRAAVAWAAVGGLIGLALGGADRLGYGQSVLPESLTGFALVAALIGSAEELVYRGYVQGRVRAWGPLGAVAFAAACHAAYKTLLFALPPGAVAVNYLFLASATFLGGLLFGGLREWSGSALPPVAAHAVFDVVVYGAHAQAPWWVWA